MNWSKIEKEALKYFKDLLKTDTTNPPGNEIVAINYLKSILTKEKIKTSIFAKDKKRANLYARLKGGSQSPLILTSHVDVVPANKNEWDLPPFAAKEKDGFIYARGALDMKHMTIYTLMAVLLLKRLNIKLNRDIILLAVSDEEQGSQMGMHYLVENHKEILDAEYALNEFGGFTLAVGNKKFYPIQVAEKGFLWLKVIIKGESGHASIPHKKNPMYLLPQVLSFFNKFFSPLIPIDVSKTFIHSLKNGIGGIKATILGLTTNKILGNKILSILPEEQSLFFNAILHNTASTTMIKGSNANNVIPDNITLSYDIRILPGYNTQDIFNKLQTTIKKQFKGQVEIEIINTGEPVINDYNTPLFNIIKDVMKEVDNGIAIPYIISGFTDANALAKLGIKTYGFSPVKLPEGFNFSKTIHNKNERIPIDGFKFGVKTFFEVVKRFVEH